MIKLQKPKLLIFDVNETLLDMSKVKIAVNKLFNNQHAFDTWFSLLLQNAMVETITSTYHHFGEIAKASMKMTAEKLDYDIDDHNIENVIKMMIELPPHSDVVNGLKMLQKFGYRMVALTNGALSIVEKQMKYAQISSYFERLFSVEEVKAFKPKKETYSHVLKTLGVKANEALLIAAHSWDIAGGKSAGLQTAYIARKDQLLYPLMDAPEIIANELEQAADELVKL